VSFHRFLNERDQPARAEHRLTVLSPRADGHLAERINQYISNLAGRSESGGAAQAAWWSGERPVAVARLLERPVSEFEACASDALSALVAVAHPASRSGLVVLARAEDGGITYVAALKLVLSEEQLARFDDEAGGDDPIIEERISNVLPKPSEVKKGALVPHPENSADARVVDEQLQDPAGYWLTWLGLTARPKEPGLAKLAVHTARVVATELLGSEEDAGQAIAAALAEKSSQGGPVSMREFSDAVARTAHVDARQLWTAIQSREPGLEDRRLAVAAEALARVEIVITLDDGVTVRGPASALAGRYTIRPAGDGDGWVTELQSIGRPEVKEETKRGGARTR
jgi:hypothetical protein